MLVSVVIPTYNEEGNIKFLLNKIRSVLNNYEYEIIICDDSTDNTIKKLRQYIKDNKLKNIKYFHRTNEKGLASAVVRGFSMCEGKYIAVMDADLQHPPVLLKQMLCAMDHGADMCIPTRFITYENENLNWYRKFISFVARKMAGIFVYNMKNITDPTSGVFMINSKVLENTKLNPIGWKIMIEVIACSDNINKIIEIPYKFMERHSGQSKLNADVTIKYIKHLNSLRKRQIKNNIEVTKWSSSELSINMDEF